MIKLAGDPKPIPQVDGYGVPFDEESQLRHLKHILAAKGDENFKLSVPDVPVYSSETWKEKPAGSYHKGTGI